MRYNMKKREAERLDAVNAIHLANNKNNQEVKENSNSINNINYKKIVTKPEKVLLLLFFLSLSLLAKSY